MSENYSYEKILPIAPLKIVALEGCRDLAKEVDKFLVDFREKGNQEFQDTPNFHGYHEETYLLKSSCPRFGSGEAKGILYDMKIICLRMTIIRISNESSLRQTEKQEESTLSCRSCMKADSTKEARENPWTVRLLFRS